MIAVRTATWQGLREARAAAHSLRRRLDAANAAYEASALVAKPSNTWDDDDLDEFRVWDRLTADLCTEHLVARAEIRELIGALRRRSRRTAAAL